MSSNILCVCLWERLKETHRIRFVQMGNCLSPQQVKMGHSKDCAKTLHQQFTVKLVHYDGTLQEFNRPVRASEVLLEWPGCFICCSESMFIGSAMPQVCGDEELQVGQIYFLMPLSRSKAPLSLQEICSLATKASAALIGSHGNGELQDRGGHVRQHLSRVEGNR
ncbi:uncharacterized protein LOC116204188 [Punica granatum]|nr:uncharacterized protein LOC116204188 [Punica granatum]OWM83777.1 hypothetical protein CDL15_Pgr004208 [Punica granatum]